MKKESPHIVNSVSEQHRLLSLPKPHHPLVSVFNLKDIDYRYYDKDASPLLLDLYVISLKKNVKGKLKYGQGYYDFDEGVMMFTAPKQIFAGLEVDNQCSGWCVAFHPDLIRRHALGKKIKEYTFFSYAVNEALHLSEKEEESIVSIIALLEQELHSSIDHFSENVIIGYIELLLSYADRFYNRQFITRKVVSHDLLSGTEQILKDYFEKGASQEKGLPTVEFLAQQLNLSAGYLSDMLRSLTGQTAQQHIHNYMIEKAKEILTTTNLSVSEIAYHFGFEYPQSFNKLFKNKTNQTPLQYRQSFN
ncbi:MAG: helix-turn-helix transcriptional regulator [Chitinophagaceae bacterium]